MPESYDLGSRIKTAPGSANFAAKTTAYTCTADDDGTLFTNRGATGAVTFTLPTAATHQGIEYTFYVIADQSVTVAATAGELVVFNNSGATSIAFSTAGEKIGSVVHVISDGTDWLASVHLAAESVTPTIA